MALDGAPWGPSMNTSSGGLRREWVVTGRRIFAAEAVGGRLREAM